MMTINSASRFYNSRFSVFGLSIFLYLTCPSVCLSIHPWNPPKPQSHTSGWLMLALAQDLMGTPRCGLTTWPGILHNMLSGF